MAKDFILILFSLFISTSHAKNVELDECGRTFEQYMKDIQDNIGCFWLDYDKKIVLYAHFNLTSRTPSVAESLITIEEFEAKFEPVEN